MTGRGELSPRGALTEELGFGKSLKKGFEKVKDFFKDDETKAAKVLNNGRGFRIVPRGGGSDDDDDEEEEVSNGNDGCNCGQPRLAVSGHTHRFPEKPTPKYHLADFTTNPRCARSTGRWDTRGVLEVLASRVAAVKLLVAASPRGAHVGTLTASTARNRPLLATRRDTSRPSPLWGRVQTEMSASEAPLLCSTSPERLEPVLGRLG